METQVFTLTWTVAQLPDGQFVAVANLGGFTLRSSVCKTPLEATRYLLQLAGGAYNNPDADLGLSLALSNTSLQDIGAMPAISDGKKGK